MHGGSYPKLSTRGINFYVSWLRQASLPVFFVHRVTEPIFADKARRFARRNGFPSEIPNIPYSEIEKLRQPELQSKDTSIDTSGTLAKDRYTAYAKDNALIRYKKRWRNNFSAHIKPDESADMGALWQSARLQHVTTALAGRKETGDTESESALKGAKDAVLTWLSSNPFLLGPHYMSTMECGLRIPVFFYCLKGLDGLTEAERLRLLTAIYEHGWWVFHGLSSYPSAGSHTIAEAVGLVFAGAIFRSTEEGKAWLDGGHSLLEQELTHQILPDGGPAGQSLNYHRFILDLYWLAMDFLEKNGLADCSAWKPRLTAGEKFLKSLEDTSGNLPSIGDSDDGHAVAPGIHPKRHGDDSAETRPCVTFPESGYTVIRGVDGLLLTLDHGPLGMAPLFNHSHADALSITLSVAGQQILVDPGTYRYNGAPEWYKHFKGTKAHNTVMVDDKDQATQETGSIWSHPYRSTLIQVSCDGGNPYVEATHDGYEWLPEPVTHRRVVDFCSDSLILIKDSFSGQGLHKFELNFHLHPEAALVWKDKYSVIRKGMAGLSITLLGGKQFRAACGERTPPFGWYSPEYGVKVQSPVLSCQVYGTPDQVSFVTAVSLGLSAPDIEGLEETANARKQKSADV